MSTSKQTREAALARAFRKRSSTSPQHRVIEPSELPITHFMTSRQLRDWTRAGRPALRTWASADRFLIVNRARILLGQPLFEFAG